MLNSLAFFLALSQEIDKPPEHELNLFNLSGTVIFKYFVYSEEYDLIRADYTEYNSHPDEELGMALNVQPTRHLAIQAYPYLWHSNTKYIARIGLAGTVTCSPDNNFLIGFGHHSWHNADIESPFKHGRDQNWLFTTVHWETWQNIRLSLKFAWYLTNNDPIEIKDTYLPNDQTALFSFSLPTAIHYWNFVLDAEPYCEFSSTSNRYGIQTRLSYKLSDQFNLICDSHYYAINEKDRTTVTLGVAILLR